MMFSSHRDLMYKNSALQVILVKLLFIEYGLSKKYPLHEKAKSDYISTNSRIHHRFRIYASPINIHFTLPSYGGLLAVTAKLRTKGKNHLYLWQQLGETGRSKILKGKHEIFKLGLDTNIAKKCSKFLSRNSHKIPKFLLNLV